MTINQAHSPTDGGHHFSTVSSHSTSDGRIAYRRCNCGLWRVERYPTDGRRLLEAQVDQCPGAMSQRRGPSVDEGVRTRTLATGCKA